MRQRYTAKLDLICAELEGITHVPKLIIHASIGSNHCFAEDTYFVLWGLRGPTQRTRHITAPLYSVQRRIAITIVTHFTNCKYIHRPLTTMPHKTRTDRALAAFKLIKPMVLTGYAITTLVCIALQTYADIWPQSLIASRLAQHYADESLHLFANVVSFSMGYLLMWETIVTKGLCLRVANLASVVGNQDGLKDIEADLRARKRIAIAWFVGVVLLNSHGHGIRGHRASPLVLVCALLSTVSIVVAVIMGICLEEAKAVLKYRKEVKRVIENEGQEDEEMPLFENVV